MAAEEITQRECKVWPPVKGAFFGAERRRRFVRTMTKRQKDFMSKNGWPAKLKAKAKELKFNISALFLAYKRKDISIFAKILIVLTVGYALSPVDLIPDFIPVLGYLDDLIILPLLIYLSLKLVPKEIMEECKAEAKDLWKDGKPKKWRYALPVAAIYLLLVFIIVKNIAARTAH